MLKKVLAAGAVAAAVAALAVPAHAAGSICATTHAEVNGEVLVDRTDCVDLPE